MKKFLIGLIAGALLAGLVAIVVVFALMRVGQSRPSIEEGSTLVLRLSGTIPERVPVEYPFPLLSGGASSALYEIWAVLDHAAEDPRIEAVVVIPDGVTSGWGRLREIRDSLLHFRESGKPLVAYLESASGRDYYLATGAGNIYMAREDLLDVKGLRAEAVYLGDTLNKIGVEVELEHAGRFKDFGDTYARNSMTPETRLVLNSMLDALYTELVTAIAEGRGRQVNQIVETLDEGPFLAEQALEFGLVDGLMFEDEMFDNLRTRLGQDEIRKLTGRRYIDSIRPGRGYGSGARIALVVAEGTIMRGVDGDVAGFLSPESFGSVLDNVGRDETIRGVILRINSPGGDAVASDELLHDVKLLSERKPVVISMSDTAASGGYYMAMTGDHVIAYPGTVTGSIGVIYGKLNAQALYEKLGVQFEILKRGRFADIDTNHRPLDEGERAKLREGVDAVYRRFLQVVSEGRGLPIEEVEQQAQGRAWLGSQAVENGLVDELGGLNRALDLIRVEAGVDPDDSVHLIAYPRRRTLWDLLLEERRETSLETRLAELLGMPEIRLLSQGGIMKLMPYRIGFQ